MIEFCENQVEEDVFVLLYTLIDESEQVECRRTCLLEYFGEHFDSDQCKATCDNCKNRKSGELLEKVDVTEDCLVILDMGLDIF